jgi:hypothetical protein
MPVSNSNRTAPSAKYLRGRRPAARVPVQAPVADRPQNGTGFGSCNCLRQAFRRLCRAEGESEVENLDATVRHEKDVFRLQVAMHDALVVRSGQPPGDLDGDFDRLARRERAVLQRVADGAAVEQFRDRVGDLAVDSEIEDREDVRMRERGDRLRLAFETRAAFCVLSEP